MIDPRAVVHESAQIAEGVEIGPYSVIGADVEIGEGCRIGPHVVINGPTRIGRDCQIFQFCSIGEAPQHKGHKGEPTTVEIGDRNIIREYVSIHRGTLFDDGVTRVGNDNMIMAYCHIAHDVKVGNHVTMANGASMAGHAQIGDHVILGGFALVYQFCRIGAHSYLGYASGTSKDVPPFVMVSGQPAAPHGVNAEGMRRRGFSKEDIQAVREAYRILYRSNLRLVEAREKLDDLAGDNDAVRAFREFLSDSKRSIVR